MVLLCDKMENQFNSPTSSIAPLKENKWTGEYVDNSPECNPISYDFLPQSGSPKGDETPVAKKKRTSLKNFGSSPITARVQQRLLPPPPSERLEDLKKFTNLYKALLSGTGDEADGESGSGDMLSDVMNSTECLDNIMRNESNDSSLCIPKVPDKIKTKETNLLVRDGASASKKSGISNLVRFSPSQNSCKKTPTRTVEEKKSGEKIRSNSPMGNRASSLKLRENNRLVTTRANQNSRVVTSKPKVEDKHGLISNEILLLNDGNDDGFTFIDDTTLLSLCSGSQTTTPQIYNTQENKWTNKCKTDNNTISVINNIPAQFSTSAPNVNCSAKISAPNKCLTKVAVPNKCSAQEIERKRREAMKKLLERRKINSQIHSQKVS